MPTIPSHKKWEACGLPPQLKWYCIRLLSSNSWYAFFPGLFTTSYYLHVEADISAKLKPVFDARIQEIFGNSVLFAPPKKAYRIKQKYQEYGARLLTYGPHVYSKFKDLFRASILVSDYLEHVDKLFTPNAKVKVTNIKYSHDNAVYQDCKVLLSVNTYVFELKVVASLESVPESHKWYELQRESSAANLDEFCNRELGSLAIDQILGEETV